jgi:phosphoribosylamine--glycine ligase
MAGNIGPNSGEMGTSMVWMNKNRIYKESIGKIVELLKKNNYTGYFDINCIADDKNLWPLEFTTRFGYPTIQLKMETIKGNMGDWMLKIVKGEKANFQISNPYSICVVMATPPYPFTSKEIYKKYSEDQEVIFKAKDRTGIWPGEVQRDKNNIWYLTGESGFSVIVTGQGKSIKESQDMAYKRVESVIIPNEMHRIDIGDKTEENLKKLNSWGWFS